VTRFYETLKLARVLVILCWIAGTAGCATDSRRMLATESCQSMLHRIQGAKDTWALEHRRSDTDTPTDADLFGPSGYIREKPSCPLGGTYTLGVVREHPRCSIPEHTY